MTDKPLKRPRDPAQLPKFMIDIASGDAVRATEMGGVGSQISAAAGISLTPLQQDNLLTAR